MGGKRPDQYRITPEETLSTDYKTRPLNTDDAVADDQAFSRTMESKEGPWEAGMAPSRGRKDRKKRNRS